MRKIFLTGLALLLVTSLSAQANANSHRNRHVGISEFGYWSYKLGPGSGPPPYAAYQTIVRYGPGNRRCISQLVQLPSGWWRPLKRCERIVVARQ